MFKNTAKQNEAVTLMSSCVTSLLEGGARSGKTAIITKAIAIRAIKYPDTKHLMARLRFNHARAALWHDTLPKVTKLLGFKHMLQWNSHEMFIRFPNGSSIWLAGTDDDERVEKILGQEYASIFLNEVSQVDFDTYEILRTRLNPPRGVPARFFLDLNPSSKRHWVYKMFHERVLPNGEKIPENDFKHLLMNPDDNRDNLSEQYFETLAGLSAQKKKRFLLGQYSDDEGNLWKRDWIKYKPVKKEELDRIVISVDPSGSKEGDEVGIVVAGEKGKDFWILDDCSMHGTPKEWGDEVIRAYEKWEADCVVAEKNFGGDMVEATITDMGRRNLKVVMVNASRGKLIRAEPISAMYERGQVYHRVPFYELEDEYCYYKGEQGEKSPNRLDAAVQGLTELSGGELSMADIV